MPETINNETQLASASSPTLLCHLNCLSHSFVEPNDPITLPLYSFSPQSYWNQLMEEEDPEVMLEMLARLGQNLIRTHELEK